MCSRTLIEQSYGTDLIPADEFSERQLIDSSVGLAVSFVVLVGLFGLLYLAALFYCLANVNFDISTESFDFSAIDTNDAIIPIIITVVMPILGFSSLLVIFAIVGGTLLLLPAESNLIQAAANPTISLQAPQIPVAVNPIQAIRGLRGPQGPQGIQGDLGFPGVDGLSGNDGNPGNHGTQGYPGWPADPITIENKEETKPILMINAGYHNPFEDDGYSSPGWSTDPVVENFQLIYNQFEPTDVTDDRETHETELNDNKIDVETHESDEEPLVDPWYTEWSHWR